MKLFADDTNCFLSGNDLSSLERLAETELNKPQTWINANNLKINYDPKKSSYCIFKRRNKCFPPNYNSKSRYKYTKIQRNYQISRPFIGQQINMGKSYSRVE